MGGTGTFILVTQRIVFHTSFSIYNSLAILRGVLATEVCVLFEFVIIIFVPVEVGLDIDGLLHVGRGALRISGQILNIIIVPNLNVVFRVDIPIDTCLNSQTI